ncbi:Uncharacterized protein HZ326_6062 [Fusarium oxysporum f. sp. albedinis]|nr:Uncharacterized protein HZ326_6062 [Fusarium oxysporum f. sp. albedinis]
MAAETLHMTLSDDRNRYIACHCMLRPCGSPECKPGSARTGKHFVPAETCRWLKQGRDEVRSDDERTPRKTEVQLVARDGCHQDDRRHVHADDSFCTRQL